jgi:hypothetical protein
MAKKSTEELQNLKSETRHSAQNEYGLKELSFRNREDAVEWIAVVVPRWMLLQTL